MRKLRQLGSLPHRRPTTPPLLLPPLSSLLSFPYSYPPYRCPPVPPKPPLLFSPPPSSPFLSPPFPSLPLFPPLPPPPPPPIDATPPIHRTFCLLIERSDEYSDHELYNERSICIAERCMSERADVYRSPGVEIMKGLVKSVILYYKYLSLYLFVYLFRGRAFSLSLPSSPPCSSSFPILSLSLFFSLLLPLSFLPLFSSIRLLSSPSIPLSFLSLFPSSFPPFHLSLSYLPSHLFLPPSFTSLPLSPSSLLSLPPYQLSPSPTLSSLSLSPLPTLPPFHLSLPHYLPSTHTLPPPSDSPSLPAFHLSLPSLPHAPPPPPPSSSPPHSTLSSLLPSSIPPLHPFLPSSTPPPPPPEPGKNPETPATLTEATKGNGGEHTRITRRKESTRASRGQPRPTTAQVRGAPGEG
ncbi:hypothetical protein C7M84_007348 [Penaeus vannamei]|uniref:Uncharacterized protein n=1 Tax=Penaeus vannamei TaxID=6689 RepID=A0A423TCD4_PENVA|nr:hypothetical protein C7M84_007348 [Penaeus vannamei]